MCEMARRRSCQGGKNDETSNDVERHAWGIRHVIWHHVRPQVSQSINDAARQP
jgi:hypothetical protein